MATGVDFGLDYANTADTIDRIKNIISKVQSAMDEVNNAFKQAGYQTNLEWFDELSRDWHSRAASNVENATSAMTSITSQLDEALITAQNMET